jgi:RNA-directed DNA polymerase
VRTADQIGRANTILRGWVSYFRVGNSSRVFQKIRWFVELRLRRVLQRKAGRHGYGWKRYDFQHLYGRLGLYSDYRVRWYPTRP